MRIYLANVGANKKTGGLASPLLEDGRFEFLPILAGDRRLDESPNAIRYRDLRSHYDRAQDLASRIRIPDRLLGKAVHNSPEFETFTYCDACDEFPRAANLKGVEAGDVLLFAAGLRRWDDDAGWMDDYGLHLIGGFHIEKDPLQAAGAEPDPQASKRFAKNAYVIKGRETGDWGSAVGDWLFAGSEKSRRFDKAVPLNREICDQVFRDIKGASWDWGRQSETATVASYTRSARCLLDTNGAEEAERAAILMRWIAKHTGDQDAALLTTQRVGG